MDKKDFRVAIFGSARIKRNDVIYKDVYELARFLGNMGVDVITGGGPGLMDAANSGLMSEAKKSNTGARSIGLGIKLPKEKEFNKHIDIKKEYQKFSGRLDEFMSLSDIVIVAPGGIGTMLEFLYTWQLVQVRHIKKIPIILDPSTTLLQKQ